MSLLPPQKSKIRVLIPVWDAVERLLKERVVGEASGLKVVIGSVSSGGAPTGTGFSSSRSSTGNYTLTFPAGTFSETPKVAPLGDLENVAPSYGTKSATSFVLNWRRTSDGLATDTAFDFTATGRKP